MKMRCFWIFVLSLIWALPAQGNVTDQPVILIHGGGPTWLVNMQRFATYLEDAGWNDRDILHVAYRPHDSLDQISNTFADQVIPFLDRYPGKKAIVIGHSLGHFVALHGVLTNELSSRIDTLIGLAGVAFGQDGKPGICRMRKCGEVYEKLSPFRNPWILEFYSHYEQELASIKLCSLYSPKDRMVKAPVDSGNFDIGTNIAVDTTHAGFIYERWVAEEMLSGCFL